MKKLLAAVLAFAPAICDALPPNYLRLNGAGRIFRTTPQVYFNPAAGIGETTIGSFLPILYHSHEDGYVVIPGEDYALGAGVAGSGSSLLVPAGLTFNLSEPLKALALVGLSTISKEGSYQNLKAVLAPAKGGSPVDASLSLSLNWAGAPYERWKGYFLVGAGEALKFSWTGSGGPN